MTNDYSELKPETRTLIGGSESRDVEFKQSQAGLESSDLVAFANAEGGVIFIGVREELDGTGMKHGIIVGQGGDGGDGPPPPEEIEVGNIIKERKKGGGYSRVTDVDPLTGEITADPMTQEEFEEARKEAGQGKGGPI